MRLATGLLICCALMPSAKAQTNSSKSVTIPIRMRHGDLLVKTRVNGSGPMEFKLDSGFGISVINPNKVESLKLEPLGHMSIIGIAGEERAATYKGAVFEFGGKTYEPRSIAALPSEARRQWRTRDGILGAGFFRRFVVILDVSKKELTLCEPEDFSYEGKGEIIPVTFKRDTPIIDASVVVKGKPPVQGKFELDTGCDDIVCLGQEFVAANRLLDEVQDSKSDARNGVGGSADIKTGKLAELRIGRRTIQQPAANFFLDGSPAGDGQAGHIGLGALQRYRVIFDYSRKRMIVEENNE